MELFKHTSWLILGGNFKENWKKRLVFRSKGNLEKPRMNGKFLSFVRPTAPEEKKIFATLPPLWCGRQVYSFPGED